MKTFIILIIGSFFVNIAFPQIQNPIVKRSEVPQCEIMQIGLTDSATHVFFKYTAPKTYINGGWICAGEDFYIQDTQYGKKYKMINSLNIPICPSKEVLSNVGQIHYFSLSFEPIPKSTKEIDIIESLKGGFNFFGVSLEQITSATPIDYISLLEATPVKENGGFIKDGKNVQYYVFKGIVVTMHLAIESTYGKYYTAYISIENNSDKRFDFYPESVSAKIYFEKDSFTVQALTYEQYMKKVKKSQNWNSFFVALGESSAAMNAGKSYSQSKSTTTGYVNSNSYSSGYFGNENRSVSSNVRTYGNFTTNTSTYNYDATANYYAQQNARNNLNNLNRQNYEIKESINQGYLKANTIFPGQRVNGLMNIPFKKADFVVVTINLNGENYSFSWNNTKH